jgi:hypothetical protein
VIDAAVEAVAFIELHGLRTLNVAGPRESSRPGAARVARELIAAVLQRLRKRQKAAI